VNTEISEVRNRNLCKSSKSERNGIVTATARIVQEKHPSMGNTDYR
jgi:hypothetical protein